MPKPASARTSQPPAIESQFAFNCRRSNAMHRPSSAHRRTSTARAARPNSTAPSVHAAPFGPPVSACAQCSPARRCAAGTRALAAEHLAQPRTNDSAGHRCGVLLRARVHSGTGGPPTRAGPRRRTQPASSRGVGSDGQADLQQHVGRRRAHCTHERRLCKVQHEPAAERTRWAAHCARRVWWECSCALAFGRAGGRAERAGTVGTSDGLSSCRLMNRTPRLFAARQWYCVDSCTAGHVGALPGANG